MGEFKTEVLVPIASESESDVPATAIVDVVAVPAE